MPNNYCEPFVIDQPVGNNAFSFEQRSNIHQPKIHIPSLIKGGEEDVKLGDEIVFEEYADEKLHQHTGLKHFVHTTLQGVDIYIFDNHNHALYFWALNARHSQTGLKNGTVSHGDRSGGQTLIHIDQHSDMRVPELTFDQFVTGENIRDLPKDEQVFGYTNYHLNIGNFIIPAQQMGIVSDVIQVTGSIDDFKIPDGGYILDIDLDYFAPEMDFLPVEPRLQLIRDLIPQASVITIATSPYFLDQAVAITILDSLLRG